MAEDLTGGGMGGGLGGENPSFSDIGGEGVEPGEQSGIEGQFDEPAGGTE